MSCLEFPYERFLHKVSLYAPLWCEVKTFNFFPHILSVGPVISRSTNWTILFYLFCSGCQSEAIRSVIYKYTTQPGKCQQRDHLKGMWLFISNITNKPQGKLTGINIFVQFQSVSLGAYYSVYEQFLLIMNFKLVEKMKSCKDNKQEFKARKWYQCKQKTMGVQNTSKQTSDHNNRKQTTYTSWRKYDHQRSPFHFPDRWIR